MEDTCKDVKAIVKGAEVCGAASTFLDGSVENEWRGREVPVRDGGETDTETQIGDDRATCASSEEVAAVVAGHAIQQPQRFRSIGEKRGREVDTGHQELEQQRVFPQPEQQLPAAEGGDLGEDDDEKSCGNLEHEEC